jgi:hypothetical protein
MYTLLYAETLSIWVRIYLIGRRGLPNSVRGHLKEGQARHWDSVVRISELRRITEKVFSQFMLVIFDVREGNVVAE